MKSEKLKVKSRSHTINNLKVALVVEHLTQLGGAERVLDVLLEIFPSATVFAAVWDKEKTRHQYDKFQVKTSFLQKMPFGVKKYKWYLPLMPKAFESFNLQDYDLIISSVSALSKGVKTSKNQLHICYCHTPTRYLWSDSESYIKTAPIPFFVRPIMPLVIKKLKNWDLKASKRPDFFIANSLNVQKRIKKYYKRDSEVMFPPTDVNKFKISPKIGNYFLLVSRIEPYKKVDLVINAFCDQKIKLKIAGIGTKQKEIKKMANKNIEFLGRVNDEKLKKLYSECKALIFPQEEDFGLVPVEAAASGRPTIAYRAGGALETVISGKTGEFFFPQTADALGKVVSNFNWKKYNPRFIRTHSEKFDKKVFKKQFLEYIESRIANKKKGILWN